jgi:hypothetical protein
MPRRNGQPPPGRGGGRTEVHFHTEHSENKRPIDAVQDLGSTAFDYGEPHVRSVYDGRTHVGDSVGRSIRATRPDGTEIGVFDTIEEPRASVVRDAYSRPEGDQT